MHGGSSRLPPLLRGPGFHLPDQAAVVRRHRQVVHQSQPDAAREFVDRLEVADPRARVARLQPRVEVAVARSEEHTSELQSLMRISYAVSCLKKNKLIQYNQNK